VFSTAIAGADTVTPSPLAAREVQLIETFVRLKEMTELMRHQVHVLLTCTSCGFVAKQLAARRERPTIAR
jgi:hypothetical protein